MYSYNMHNEKNELTVPCVRPCRVRGNGIVICNALLSHDGTLNRVDSHGRNTDTARSR